MKSDIIHIDNRGVGFDAALAQTEKVAQFRELGEKETLRLRICAEEMLGYLPTMDDYDRGSYASKDAFFLYRRIPTLRGEAERVGEELGNKLAAALKGERKS